jgi:hypothetical protein
MGRSLNQKCWACSLLLPEQARQQHELNQGGDGCWDDAVCHSRRSYYRQGRGNRVRRQPQMSEVVVPIPSVPYVVLHTYVEQPRQLNDDVVIHAMCAELWVGNQPIALTQPQHTFGLPPRLVKDYARQLLEALYQQYGKGRRSGFERFAREEQHAIAQCPIRPCSYHAEHLQFIETGGRG